MKENVQQNGSKESKIKHEKGAIKIYLAELVIPHVHMWKRTIQYE